MAGRASRQKVGDYFTLQRGTTYKSRLLGLPGPVLLGLASIQRNGGFRRSSLQTYGGDSPDKLLVRPGDLYLSLKDVTQSADLLGAVARLPLDHAVGRLTQDTVKLQPRSSEVPLEYLYWLLRTPQYRSYCRSHATGTTNLGLAREDFLIYPAPEPTDAQSRLVETLTALEEKIELNRRMSETLEAMARALFKSWFVDFDHIGTNPQVVQRELGSMPIDWAPGRLAEVCQAIFSGGTPSTSEARYWGGSIPWLSSGETRSKLIIDTEKSITSEGVQHSSTRLARAGSTVIASAGQGHTRGQTSLLTFDSYVNQSVVVLQANQSKSSDLYLFFDLERRYEQFRQMSDGHSSRGSLTTRLLADLHVATPPKNLVEAFDRAAGPLVARMTQCLHESRTLAALRDTLLPKLISGELRVKDAERFVGRAV